MVLALIKSAMSGPKPATGKDRRVLPRVEENRATLVLNDVSYPLIDWNPNGFQIAPYTGRLRLNEKIRIRLILPHKGKSHGFDLNGRVRRLDPQNKAVGGEFIDVSAKVSAKLKKLFAQRLR
ncbi:MAG: hypothetical protein ACPGRZ_09815 [Alphaproteobacteria bacterium]